MADLLTFETKNFINSLDGELMKFIGQQASRSLRGGTIWAGGVRRAKDLGLPRRQPIDLSGWPHCKVLRGGNFVMRLIEHSGARRKP